jgi:glycosyltransferase involved in cell wall biosynthesis
MLSVVLPCYNEKDNLSALFQRLDLLVQSEPEIEIVIVNNGSTDGSDKVIEKELKVRNEENFKVCKVEKNLGYGHGILNGLKFAKGDVLSVTHADRQTDPMDVLKAFELYNSANDSTVLVKGYRKNRRVSEAIFSYGMGLLASLVLKTRLTEINAQPKLFSRVFFEKVQKHAPHDFSLDLYFLYHAKRFGKIIDFPVYFSKRVAGEAKGGSGSSLKIKWKLIKRSFNYIFKLSKTTVNHL